MQEQIILTKEEWEELNKDRKEYLSPKEIEERLKLSHATVSKLINIKGFPSIRIGRNIRVKAEDLESFLDTYRTHTINI